MITLKNVGQMGLLRADIGNGNTHHETKTKELLQSTENDDQIVQGMTARRGIKASVVCNTMNFET